MEKKFNINREREYYNKKELPQDLFILDDNVVENIMQFCTNTTDWPSMLNNKIILEVGAGECPYMSYILKRSNPKLYIASDIFMDRMSYPKNLLFFDNIRYLGSNVLNLPLRSESVDFCIAQGLLHHIPNLDEAIAEIAHVLKVGGFFLFREPWAGNPLIWLKYRVIEKSENEFPLTRKKVMQSFSTNGLELGHLGFFWLRFPKLPAGPWSVNIGGLAVKKSNAKLQ